MIKKKKTLIVLAGPTAVGKTHLSIQLAKRFETEIISADSRQFYREMELGTAKPSDREMQAVPHHFINSHSIKEDYNVGQYERDTLKLLEVLFEKKDVVLLVGGSGLYIKAICQGIADMPQIPMEIREKWNQQFLEKGIGFLQAKLQEIDPDYYQIVDQQNPQRLIRALELYEVSGKNMTHFRAQSNAVARPFDVIKVGLERPREELYQRIDLRMDQMIAAGLFVEAESLYPFRHLNALQTVGYSEIFAYLDGEYDRNEAVRLLKRNSRRYAKRQMTWFKKDPDFVWFSAQNGNEILSYLESRLIGN